jgi:mannose-1-phosphate guanylyltransferase
VAGDFGWTDVGDFNALAEVLPTDEDGNVVLGEDDGLKPGVLLTDSTGLVVVPHSGRLVATLGVRDLVVVDTPDVVLVCTRERAQDVKRLVDRLKEDGEAAHT